MSINLNLLKFLVFIVSLLLLGGTVFSEEVPEESISLIEAVRTTLAKDPNIQIQVQAVKIKEGLLKTTKGAFDLRLGSYIQQNRDRIPVKQDTLTYSVDMSKTFRSGIEATPSFKITQTDNLSTGIVTNTATLDFTLKVPLLEGGGAGAPGVNESAALINYEVSRLELEHLISLRVLATVNGYWSYLAAKKNLDIYTTSESQARLLVKDTESLIKGGEVPAADLKQARANLANKTAARITTEQALLRARKNLGLSMGLSAVKIMSLPRPSDKFIQKQDIPQGSTIQSLIQQAGQQRADLLASTMKQKSSQVLFKAAKHNLKPRLDLIFGVGYDGRDADSQSKNFLENIYGHETGVNVVAKVAGDWPLGNNSDAGLKLQNESIHKQNVLRTGNLARDITSSVIVAEAALKSRAEELAKYEEAVELYGTVVQNEKKKLTLGTSTLIDVVLTQDHLTNARLNKVSGQLGYAQALAQLRYEIGALISSEENINSIDMERLTTVP